ncbi:MAG: hypothetical protein LQ343_004839 [Gyalolechia ehrenbergii]|nr:MAG: hypothetical protein LQ343_004839 [Gyalolechia ehrenbergii]
MPNTNTSHCNPRPETYDWYEYTTSWKCSETQCRAHTINWSTTNETQPYFEDEYVLSSIDIGNGKLGQFGVSYFDSKGGGYAIGTKRILSDETGDPEVVMDCKDAFRTLLEIQKDKNIDLPFDMVDICPFQKGGQAQKVLGGDLK